MAATSARRTISRVRAAKAQPSKSAKQSTAVSKAAAKPKAPAKSKSPAEAKAKSASVPPITTDDETTSSAAAGSPQKSRPAPTTNDATAARLAAGSPEGSRKAQSKESRRAPTKSSPTKKSLVQRVYNTIDGELTKLEKQKGLTSQDRERASRALSQMVNALEKAVEMQREMTKRKTTGGDAKSKEALAHAEDLRREIAERLERLNRKRAPGRRSE